MPSLSELLRISAARHDHLCPRQVLGVRMGLAGLRALSLEAPISKPTGLIIVETDGCFVDGIEVTTGASVGHRTLRVEDMGKIAATFVEVATGRAVRLAPRAGVRTLAFAYASNTDERYRAQLEGYQVMPQDELFVMREVMLDPPLRAVLSRPDVRATCDRCGEEIINEREESRSDGTLCRTCAGRSYYVEGQAVRQNGPGVGPARNTP
jgi:formylmethanofuran dehydrogenase subunit E